MDLASELHLANRPLRVEVESVEHLRTPAILHWDMKHFVVLAKASKGRFIIHDPALGVRTLNLAELSRHFTGVALELSPAPGFAKIEDHRPPRMRDLWSGLQGVAPAVGLVGALSLALQAVVFVAPLQLQLVIDQAVVLSDRGLLLTIALAFGAIVLMNVALEALRGWTLQYFSQRFAYQVIGNLVRHLIRLPFDYFERRHVGDIVSRIGSTTAIQDAVTRGVITAVLDGVMALAAGVILFIYSGVLFGIVFAFVSAQLVASLVLFGPMRRALDEQITSKANEQTQLMETIRGAMTVKLMTAEDLRESAWRNLFVKLTRNTLTVARWQIWSTSLTTLLTGGQLVLVVYVGATLVIAGGNFSLGMFVAFMAYRQIFTDKMVALFTQTQQFRLLGLHMERISDIAHTPTEPMGHPDRRGAVKVGLGLRCLSFRYGAGDRTVLDNVNLDIAPGEFIAIEGSSGGGKTTLLKLLLGLVSPSSGDVLIDGIPAQPGDLAALRRSVGAVFQDDRLFSGSIAENIAFFDPDIAIDRVEAAAIQAGIHDEILAMPMRYRSLIGDMGSSLSGGQRQRVLLARALYRQPQILVLDEGTANLDPAAEEAIADLVASLPITRIVVAHRPALISRASRILRVESAMVSDITDVKAPKYR